MSYLALPIALAAAISFGAAAVAQHRSTTKVQTRGVMHPWLITDLARRPAWLAGVATSILGYLLQAAALHYGPLSFVQPLLVSGLLFAVAFGTFLRGQRSDRFLLAGALCCAVGLAGFLAVARPRGGTGLDIDLANGLPLAGAFTVIVVICLVVAHYRPGTVRALTLALACGIVYGINAFLLKSVTDLLTTGIIAVLVSLPLYAAAVTGPVGFLLNQAAFQAGRLPSPVLAVITTADPLVSIILARIWFGEHFAPGAWRLGPEAAFFALMTAGVMMLAFRLPRSAAPGDGNPSTRGAAATRNTGDAPAGTGTSHPIGPAGTGARGAKTGTSRPFGIAAPVPSYGGPVPGYGGRAGSAGLSAAGSLGSGSRRWRSSVSLAGGARMNGEAGRRHRARGQDRDRHPATGGRRPGASSRSLTRNG